MYYASGCSIVLYVVLYLMLPGASRADNYPSDANTKKPCARRKNTIIVQGPLCVWDNSTKCYTTESQELCTGDLWTAKMECPEFNEASCEVFNGIHCCKLRYKAKDGAFSVGTWMEVYLANQYKPGDYEKPEDNVYDVIEVHRMVADKYTKDFGNVSQPDYPQNVLDPHGARGLKWNDVKEPKPHKFKNTAIMCKDGISDDRCLDEDGETVQKYLKDNYHDGFEPLPNIPRTPYEDQIQAEIKTTYDSWCRNALIDKKKVPTCTTYYRRNGVPKDNASAITSFIFMEAQVIFDDKGKMKLRFAYWNIEDIGTRDLIFKDKTWKDNPFLGL